MTIAMTDLLLRRKRHNQIVKRERKSEKMRINALLDFFATPFEPGHGFWERNHDRLDIIMYDARKAYMAMVRKHHEAGSQPDAAQLTKANIAWEQLVEAMRKHGVECT